MDTLIKKKMIQHIVHTFQCEHIAKSAIDFVDYQASKRDFLFGSLTVLHFEMFNGEDTDIYSAAAAIEILILATDIFDDLQDQDQFDAPWQNVDRSIVLNLSVGLLLLSKKILENSNEKCTNLMSPLC